ncbi:hypothetical protein QE152_g335 [Popillia japonica]|uniref:Double jelly roll-like domain-containing protein n=1 Tax=Popillia japonica TaxID=7064 RepID=A0AAW1NM28_POPJA
MSFNNLKVNDSVYVDNSITNYEFHTYQPYAATTFNNNDTYQPYEIRIPIQTQNIYTLPSDSCIYIEGRLLKDDDTVSSSLTFVNNGLAFLFEEIRYELAGTVIDRNKNPGITSTLKSYVSFTSNQMDRLKNAGISHLEHPKIVNKDGYFNACIPLSHLLGAMEDYQKVILNVRQELVLIRSNSDINAVINNPITGTDKPKIQINKILWKVPHIIVSDAQKLKFLEYIDKSNNIQVAFRSWELQELPLVQQTTRHTWAIKTTSHVETPRFIIFGFQTDRKNSLNRDMSLFDDCELTNIKLYLNSDVFPYDNINIDFKKNQYAILYEMYSQFQKSYYYKKEVEPCLSPINFKQIAPIAVIDCSHQNEVIKNGAVDIRLEFETSTNIPEKTSAYCLILHDRLLTYNPLTNIVKM